MTKVQLLKSELRENYFRIKHWLEDTDEPTLTLQAIVKLEGEPVYPNELDGDDPITVVTLILERDKFYA